MLSINEVFAVRDNEQMFLYNEEPEFPCRYIAATLVGVSMPAGEKQTHTHDGKPVEQAGIFAAQRSHEKNEWQWAQLTPASKELVGNLLFDAECKLNTWYFVVFKDWNKEGGKCV